SRGLALLDYQLDIAVQDVKQGKQLPARLAGARGLEDQIELRGGSSKPPNGLALAQAAVCQAFLRFHGELVHERIAQVVRIFVVVQNLLGMNGAFAAGIQNVSEAL